MRYSLIVIILLSCLGCSCLTGVSAARTDASEGKILKTYDHLEKVYANIYLGKTKKEVLAGMGDPVGKHVEAAGGHGLRVYPNEDIFENGKRDSVKAIGTILVTEGWSYRIVVEDSRYVVTIKDSGNQFALQFFFYNDRLVLVR